MHELKQNKNFAITNEIYAIKEQIFKISKINGGIVKQMKLIYGSLVLFAKKPRELVTVLYGKYWEADRVDLIK